MNRNEKQNQVIGVSIVRIRNVCQLLLHKTLIIIWNTIHMKTINELEIIALIGCDLN